MRQLRRERAPGPEKEVAKPPPEGWQWPEPGTRWVLLKADVTKAHHRVKVLRKDWRFQVASLGEEWWVNKVGTYGMASAQSYWGRLAAPQVDWNFVFVDDFLWLLRSEGAVNLAVALLATLLALGTPLSWKKTHLAEVNTWLGFVVHPNIPQVQETNCRPCPAAHAAPSSPPRAACRVAYRAAGPSPGPPHDRQQTHPGDGGLADHGGRAGDALKRSRCFSHCGPGKWPPPRWGNPLRWSGCWRSCFNTPFVQYSPYLPKSSWWGCSDASASDEGLAFVGGWCANKMEPEKKEVYWFHKHIHVEEYPWAFKNGDPKRRIAALEMLGTLFLSVLPGPTPGGQ